MYNMGKNKMIAKSCPKCELQVCYILLYIFFVIYHIFNFCSVCVLCKPSLAQLSNNINETEKKSQTKSIHLEKLQRELMSYITNSIEFPKHFIHIVTQN